MGARFDLWNEEESLFSMQEGITINTRQLFVKIVLGQPR